jgi:hypothetical protein
MTNYQPQPYLPANYYPQTPFNPQPNSYNPYQSYPASVPSYYPNSNPYPLQPLAYQPPMIQTSPIIQNPVNQPYRPNNPYGSLNTQPIAFQPITLEVESTNDE